MSLSQFWNFSWVTEQLAGMARPVPFDVVCPLLLKEKIGFVVSLTEVSVLPTDAPLVVKHIPIPDYAPPTLEKGLDLVDFLFDLIERKKMRGVVHCAGGRGRTGTMLAVWHCAKTGSDGDTAIRAIRSARPGSIETPTQEEFLRDYAPQFRRRYLTLAGQNTAAGSVGRL
ncbi:putative protein tyrosine phosphatase [Paratrimastix pyriformis]|uniref:Tyrosine specific protein phosphatases domain-containing protein n=1 Tax=Paratrimastix pyriformis TaxID=342808 RepID=A0ABQ8UMI3_9EUKA|nr:putative protein tyrosine phosphatase [Paratrimastix pyriformis]